MTSLADDQLIRLLAALAVVVLLARLGGEAARRVRQPEVLGELVAGVLLGPSVLGLVSPVAERFLFSGQGAGDALSGISWIGALLVLLAAGREVDLPLLRGQLRQGVLAAAFAIVPSLLAGLAVGRDVLHLPLRGAALLGIVLSVSAISVVAKLLIERHATRRDFAQVILAGGIATELTAWILVAVVSSGHHGSPLEAACVTLALAVGFFVVVVALGRRVVYRAMRTAADRAAVTGAPLSLVVVLTLGAAAATQALGLHALLGAFVVGVLLSRAPRANELLTDRMNAITVSFFAPVFFTLAGARVDLRHLTSRDALIEVAVLFGVATVAKIGFVSLGTRLGGTRGPTALLVGAGLNAKGGTDVVVAILGMQLGLLSVGAYTDYTVVAILTVLFTPALMGLLERHSPATDTEADRLTREQLAEQAYSSGIERVLVPVVEDLHPTLAIDVLEQLALSEERPGRPLDVTELMPHGAAPDGSEAKALQDRVAANVVLQAAHQVETFATHLDGHQDLLDGIVDAAARHDLVAIGAAPRDEDTLFGPLPDAVVHRCPTDVLVVATRQPRRHLPWTSIRRVLLPTNGLPHADAAADLAGFLAQQSGAELALLHVSAPIGAPAGRWRRRSHVRAAGDGHLERLARELERFSVPLLIRRRVGEDPAVQVVQEAHSGGHDLIVLGAVDRGTEAGPYLGHTVEAVLAQTALPTVVLVTGRRPQRQPA